MKWLVNLMVFGLTCLVFGGLVVMMIIEYYTRDLPDFKQLENYAPPHLTRLYTTDGRILEEYATEMRLFVPISSIPLRLRQAFLSAEDRNFYEHSGIDFMGIGRAIFTNLINVGRGKSLVGGSTISQQVVKNFLLTSEQSLDRKVKEAILAFRISKVFSKDKVLELYLNEIYLGFNSYGVAAAALNYFNKSIDELTIEESAFLAMLPKAPSQVNPRRNYTRAVERRNYVIDRMREDGFITAEEANSAKQTPIILRERDETEYVSAPFFAEEVRRQIAKHYGTDALYQGGLTVHTTIVPEYQKMAEKALLKGIMMYDHRHGWRGPIARIPTTKAWLKQLNEVERPLGTNIWKMAVVLAVTGSEAKIGLENGNRGYIKLEDIKWARKYISPTALGPEVASAADVLSHGDIILVERSDGVEEEAEKPDSKPAEKAATDGSAEKPEEAKPEAKKEELPDEGKKDAPVHRYNLMQIPDVDGAIVVMDPHTGRVLAMVGGLGFRNIEFNRATQAKRQPGSSFKPFIYLAALERGMNATTVVSDGPLSLPQGAGLPAWSPQNYDHKYMGMTTLRVGLEKSRNVMAVRLSLMLGLDKVIDIAKRFGLYEELPKNYSIVLGSAETTLMRLVTGYAMFDNGGKRVRPVLVDRIADRHGKLIFRSDNRPCPGCKQQGDINPSDQVPVLVDTREQVTDPISAYQLVSILEGVVQRGTATKAKVLEKPLAGKTGTTNNSIDAWFIGFSPDLVAGSFIGFDQPHTLGGHETGGATALPIWIEFMKQALADKPSTPFRMPTGVKLVRVDRSTGRAAGSGVADDRVQFEALKPDVQSEDGSGGIGEQPAEVTEPEEGVPAYQPDVRQPTSELPAPITPTQPYVPRQPSTVGTGGIY